MYTIITTKEYSHSLVFGVIGEPDVHVTLTRYRDDGPLSGLITQLGYEPHKFVYSGPLKVVVLVQTVMQYRNMRLEVPSEGCAHNFQFAFEYQGKCPQPKRCTLCGALDLNGYKGDLL